MSVVRRRKRKRTDLPGKFEPGFIAETNNSTLLYKQLRRAFDEIVEDLGGESDLSHLKATLIERTVFLEAMLTKIEHDLATDPEAADRLLSRWTQAFNALVGAAKTLGIERRIREAPWSSPSGSSK